jgi:hypothetical protein
MSPVKLSEVAGNIDAQSDEMAFYIHRSTGEILLVENDVLAAIHKGRTPYAMIGSEEMIEDARRVAASKDFIALPHQRDFDGYGVMAALCRTVEDDRLRAHLETAISGKGAFRRFKDTVHRYSIEQRWYAFHNEALGGFAREFLDENGIAYEE